jgi:hypothetical protein
MGPDAAAAQIGYRDQVQQKSETSGGWPLATDISQVSVSRFKKNRRKSPVGVREPVPWGRPADAAAGPAGGLGCVGNEA